MENKESGAEDDVLPSSDDDEAFLSIRIPGGDEEAGSCVGGMDEDPSDWDSDEDSNEDSDLNENPDDEDDEDEISMAWIKEKLMKIINKEKDDIWMMEGIFGDPNVILWKPSLLMNQRIGVLIDIMIFQFH